MAKAKEQEKKPDVPEKEEAQVAPEEVKSEQKANKEKEPVADKRRYFRNRRFARESINYDNDVDSVGRTIFKKETFTGYFRKVLGEDQPFGYLVTTNADVVRVCLATSHIDEITKSEYEEETDVKNNRIRLM